MKSILKNGIKKNSTTKKDAMQNGTIKKDTMQNSTIKKYITKNGSPKNDILKNNRSVGNTLVNDEKAWADFLISRMGLLLFCSILLISAFNVYPMFGQQDAAGMMDADISSLASYIEDVDSTSIRTTHYYTFDIDPDITIDVSTKYVSAYSDTKNGRVIRAKALMTTIYPPNSLWDSRPGLLEEVAARCEGRTGLGEDVLEEKDLPHINEMLDQVETELAKDPFVPDTMQPLMVEKVILNIRTAKGIERRGVTIAYQ